MNKKANNAGKNYCSKCGLVYLNNDLTEWMIKTGCNYRDHPQFKEKVIKFTGGRI